MIKIPKKSEQKPELDLAQMEDYRKIFEEENKRRELELELHNKAQQELKDKIRRDLVREEMDRIREEAKVQVTEPIKYGKPIPAELVIFLNGGGELLLKCKEISAEEIYVTDPKWKNKPKWEKTLYYGVPPKPSHKINGFPTMLWKPYQASRKHYALDGMPFTFNPRTGRPFTDERKRELFLQKGIGAYIELQGKRFIILLSNIDKKPFLKDTLLKTDLIDWLKNGGDFTKKEGSSKLELSVETLQEFIHQWEEKKKIPELTLKELPIVHEYDVSDIVAMKAEVGQILKENLHTDLGKAMKKAGKETDNNTLFYVFCGVIFAIIVAFLWFANEGAFNNMHMILQGLMF